MLRSLKLEPAINKLPLGEFYLLYGVFFAIIVFFHNPVEFPDSDYYKSEVCYYEEVTEPLDYAYYYAIATADKLSSDSMCSMTIYRNSDFTGFGRYQRFNEDINKADYISYFSMRFVNFAIFGLLILISRQAFTLFLPFLFFSSFLTSDIYVQIFAVLFFRWPLFTSLLACLLVIFGITSETVLLLFLPAYLGGVIIRELYCKIGLKRVFIALVIFTFLFILIGGFFIGGVDLAGDNQLSQAVNHNQYGNNPFLALAASLFGAYGYMSNLNFIGAILFAFCFLVLLYNRSILKDINLDLVCLFGSSLLLCVVLSTVFPWISQIRFYPLLFASFFSIWLEFVRLKFQWSHAVSIVIFNVVSLPFLAFTWF